MKVVARKQILEEKYDVVRRRLERDELSELYRDGHAAERWNRLHPAARRACPYVTQALGNADGVLVAASDYVKALPDGIDRWLPRRLTALGTGWLRPQRRADGAARVLRVNTHHIVVATLNELARDGAIRREGRAAGDQGSRDQSREAESGHLVGVYRD
jgi:pyruvate dehydrogenase E1 component